MNISILKTSTPKNKPSAKELRFGKFFTDHMFVMDYHKEIGWHDARIVPYGPLALEPASMVLHYAQETFEGMKAYRTKEGKILLFRPFMNAKRMQRSNERLCMPPIPEEMFVEAVEALVKIDQDWVPDAQGACLYIRPFMYATEKGVGVHAASSYQFVVIASPVRSYYEKGLAPISIYVEDEYVRAVKGGTGYAKCGGNYAASIIAQEKAAKLGCTQVLWLDGIEHKYVEEVGTMNVFFKIEGKIYTADLDGVVLPGITRDSCIRLLKDWNYEVIEAPLPIEDVMEAGRMGTLEEVFGSGTAAVITPVGELVYKGEKIVINHNEIGQVTKDLYDELTGIQWGSKKDLYDWTYVVK